MSAFPEIDAFVSDLRAHYHAIGRPDADEAAAAGYTEQQESMETMAATAG